MQPQHLYHQQYQYLQPYHLSSRHSSSTLSSVMDLSYHPHHHHHQLQQLQQLQLQLHQQQQQQYPPQTPLDMNYGASMLPRQLLIGSPFVQTPLNGSPSRTNFTLLQSQQQGYSNIITGSPSPMIQLPHMERRRTHNYMSRPPTMRSLSMSSSSTSLTDYYNNGNHLNNSNTTVNVGRNISNTRSIILQDLPSNITLNQFLNNIKIGPIENCHFVNEDSNQNTKSILLSFIDVKLARKFFSEVSDNHRLLILLNAPDLKISWTLSSPMLSFVQNAINNDTATRNVYIGNLKNNITKDFLQQELQNYGSIDTIDFIEDRKIAFVHFTNIASAIKAVEQLPLDQNWSNCKIFYGKDRCSCFNNNNNNNNNNLHQLSELSNSNNDLLNTTLSHTNKLANTLLSSAGSNNIGNRCLYLGNLHSQTTVEEICNVIRGGLLQSIKLMNERHICFITFIEPLLAVQFFASTSIDGLLVHGRKLKIGWGKHSGALPNSIALLVTAGLSRNLYIGVINESDVNDSIPDEPILRQDFSEYGDIEQINFFKDGKCAFINFLNISSAIKCVEEFQKNNWSLTKFEGRYLNLKIAFGKDRCGNPSKLKKSKKNSKKLNNSILPINNYNELEQNKPENALVFASMGITSKSFTEQEVDDTKSDTKSEIEESSPLEALKEEDNEDELERKSELVELPEEEPLEPMSQSLESLPIEYESSDSDSVSILIGNNDTDLSPMTSKPSDQLNGTASFPKNSSKKNSATQLRLNNNNSRSSSFSYDNFPIYNNNTSRQSSKSHLNKYYQQGQGQMNAFATSGSQIMAQYLAQSQHENLLYATHVLTDDQQLNPVDDEDGSDYNGQQQYYYDEFQPPPHPQPYTKVYPYPMQQYPYILATPLAPPPPQNGPMQPMLYWTPPVTNGRGRNGSGGRGGYNGRGGKNNGGRNWKNNNNSNNK